ncbi:flavin reductase family protein [Microbacterium sp. 18062]|uniref:flavin reductase family protein n=1 Tax=Microbacterium sp. 18062 TaxID=2681410 RepID=UPI0013579E92|nr:flavin reductase family protein [Microbacterium sp. 18062]
MPEPAEAALHDRYARAMDGVATSVAVVTTDGPAGRFGQTVRTVAGVTDEPPTLLACLDGRGPLAEAIAGNGAFRVNHLAVGHDRVSDAFAEQRSDGARHDGFACGDWAEDAPSGPELRDALASFECRVVGTHDVGTHVVVIGEVRDVSSTPGGEPLLSLERVYRRVEELPLSVFPDFPPAHPPYERTRNAR